jgi:hypothetical protein
LAKHIYLTSLEKPPIFTRLNDSSLIQLANRVGRDSNKIPYAFVYVNSKDVDHVSTVLSNDPGEITAPLKYDQIKKGMQSSCNIDGFIHKFKSLFT